MARLTAEQLRQSLADLFGHFGDSPRTVDKRGIQGTYFKGTQRKEQDKKIDRVDPVVTDRIRFRCLDSVAKPVELRYLAVFNCAPINTQSK